MYRTSLVFSFFEVIFLHFVVVRRSLLTRRVFSEYIFEHVTLLNRPYCSSNICVSDKSKRYNNTTNILIYSYGIGGYRRIAAMAGHFLYTICGEKRALLLFVLYPNYDLKSFSGKIYVRGMSFFRIRDNTNRRIKN